MWHSMVRYQIIAYADPAKRARKPADFDKAFPKFIAKLEELACQRVPDKVAARDEGRELRRETGLPLNQLPDLGLELVRLADVCEDRRRRLQVIASLRRSSDVTQDVGDVRMDGCFAVAVADALAQLERALRECMSASAGTPSSAQHECEVVERRGDRCGIVQILGPLETRLQMVASCTHVSAVRRDDPGDVVRLHEGPSSPAASCLVERTACERLSV